VWNFISAHPLGYADLCLPWKAGKVILDAVFYSVCLDTTASTSSYQAGVVQGNQASAGMVAVKLQTGAGRVRAYPVPFLTNLTSDRQAAEPAPAAWIRE